MCFDNFLHQDVQLFLLFYLKPVNVHPHRIYLGQFFLRINFEFLGLGNFTNKVPSFFIKND